MPPTRSSRATADLTISGSVAPINDVGTIKTRNATMKRMTVIAPRESGSESCSDTHSCVSASSTNGVRNAVTPTSISARPNAASGRVMRAAKRPARKLPSPRPAMNPASTVLAA